MVREQYDKYEAAKNETSFYIVTVSITIGNFNCRWHGNSNCRQSLDTETLELLASWRHQDTTNDPELIRQAEQELTEFKKQMNENRLASGAPVVYP